MKRRDFITRVAVGTAAAGSVAGLSSCTDGDKKNTNKISSARDNYIEHFSCSQRVRSGIALGGIGAGSIELRKDGQFYNWSLMNNQPFGAGPNFMMKTWPDLGWEDSLLFFLVRYQEEGQDAKIKLLQINNSLEEGGMQSIEYYFPWMDAVSEIKYSGKFPFVNMTFSDPEMPFEIDLEAFSPFIPHDIKNSSLPGVFFNFTIRAKSDKPVDVMLLGSLRNTVGYDVFDKFFFSEIAEENKHKFFTMSAGGMDSKHVSYGTMGLASLSSDSTYYLGWEHRHPYYERLLVEKKLPNIDDTEGRNITDEKGNKRGGTTHNTLDQRREQDSYRFLNHATCSV